jgi:phage/plasmid-like protein (TIGR03299 family)
MPDFVQTCFSAGGIVPWHGKGVVIPEDAVTADIAIKAAGLDWTVGLAPVAVAGTPLDNYYATVRQDTGDVLGIVGSRYVPVQNRDMFKFFDPVVDRDKGVFYHTGGVLLGGRRVWLLAKVPGDFYVPGVADDLIQPYILLANSHDGSLHVTAKPTHIRTVCWNTLQLALGEATTTVRIKHTSNAAYELAQAHRVLGLATKQSELAKEAAEALVHLRVGGRLFKRLVKALFPSSKEKQGEEASKKALVHRERVELLFSGLDRNNLKGMDGTGWAFYNAITDYVDHSMPYRKGTDPLDRAWFGSGEDLKEKAFKLLMDQIGGSQEA